MQKLYRSINAVECGNWTDDDMIIQSHEFTFAHTDPLTNFPVFCGNEKPSVVEIESTNVLICDLHIHQLTGKDIRLAHPKKNHIYLLRNLSYEITLLNYDLD